MEVLNPKIATLIESLDLESDLIADNRKAMLKELADLIFKIREEGEVNLNFICTHNSRRSQLAEIWVKALTAYYQIKINSFSGGTEGTAFNVRMVNALKSMGFELVEIESGRNPVYKFAASEDRMFSKVFDDAMNPTERAIAVMVCSDADENCPFVPGAIRFSLAYEDPKAFDNTDLEETAYTNKVREIGREMIYLFTLIA